MMEERLRYNYIRHVCSVQGWALLLYLGIMNAAVILVTILASMTQLLTNTYDYNQLMDSSGWGYFLAIGIGAMILMLWKKPEFCFQTVWKKGRPLKFGRFMAILSVFLSVQLLAMLLSMLLEWLLFNMGYEASDAGAISTDSLSMFLYVGLGAPISEEILFRGLVLRSLEPFGKKFSMIFSALLFGMFHGNLSQAPFAFGVGIVMAYVTLEYNIGWAMLLHMINNLLLSDTLFRVFNHFFPDWGALIVWGIIVGFSIAALVILLVKRNLILDYFRREYDDPLAVRAFFGAPGMIVLLIVLALTILFSTVISIIPL